MCETISIFQNPYVSGIIGSFIASFLTIGVLEIYRSYNKKIRNSSFKKLFGTYSETKLNLILPELSVRPEIPGLLKNIRFPQPDYPLVKMGGGFVGTSKLLAYYDTISMKYLLDLISSTIGNNSIITSDEQLSKHLDLSFISFGGTSFYCLYILNQRDNNYYHFEGSEIVSKKDPTKRYAIDKDHDYGLIIKYKHESFPNRTWIIIAGIGETGTSGAGWYLARHWKNIAIIYKDNPFGIIVKVKHGIDESAISVDQTS